jgi:hypothetical protein
VPFDPGGSSLIEEALLAAFGNGNNRKNRPLIIRDGCVRKVDSVKFKEKYQYVEKISVSESCRSLSLRECLSLRTLEI